MKESDSRLMYALRLLFTPLANVLIKNRIGIGPVIEQLKIAYVTAAQKHHGNDGRPASVNKIANITGMSRKHTSALLSEAKRLADCRIEFISGVPDVISAWRTTNVYLNESGQPKPLELGPGQGSLTELAENSVGATRRDNAVRRLIESDSVRRGMDGRYELVDRAHWILDDLARILVGGPATLLSTIDRNWGKPRDGRFAFQYAHVHKLESDKLLTVRRVSNERVRAFMELIDDYLGSQEVAQGGSFQAPDGTEVSTVGVCAHYFETDYT